MNTSLPSTRCLVLGLNELLKAGIRPYNDVLSKTKFAADIRFLRVEDLQKDTLQPVRLFAGNCELKECASKLLTRTYNGWFAFAPYGAGVTVPETIADFTDALCAM